MSGFVLKTLRPQDTEHTIYYRFDNKKPESEKPKQTTKRPIQQQNNTDQETETKTKKPKHSNKQNSSTKSKTSAPQKKKTPTTREQKPTKYTFI